MSESVPEPKRRGQAKEASASKRQKITLSCNECRRRKIKCDHDKPICQNCLKKGSESVCTYTKSPWIDIIATEAKVYQEIDALKKENDELMDAVASIKSDLVLVYKKNHNNMNSTEDDISSAGHDSDHVDSSLRSSTAETMLSEENDGESDYSKRFTKHEYHFLKDTTEIPIRNRIKRILSTDSPLIEIQSYADVEVPRVLTSLRCGNDAFYKNYFLTNLLSLLPPIEVLEYHLLYYFRTNYHKHMPVLSEPMLMASFHKMFTKELGTISLDPTRELEDFVLLGIILIVLKISSLYRETALTDVNNVLLRNAYIALELGEIKIRASITTLQGLLLVTSFRLFSHKVTDLELFFSTELCRDMAIALGIHKNTEIIYEHKSKEEKQILRNIKVLLNRGW